jgi:DNA-binding transcriptional LysR family regulator
LLLEDRMFPVCSPELLMRYGQRNPARVFAEAPLLHDVSVDRDPADPSWKMWLKAGGLENIDWRKGPRFNQTALALDAALAGLGIALAPAALVATDLAAGRLVRWRTRSGRAISPITSFIPPTRRSCRRCNVSRAGCAPRCDGAGAMQPQR